MKILLPVNLPVFLSIGDMCRHPVLIPNPNYSKGKFTRINKPGGKASLQVSESRLQSHGYLNKVKDTSSRYIYVGCGYCDQCIAIKQFSVVQRAQMMCLNYHPFYLTLTYNNASLPYWEFSNGKRVAYADFRDPQLMFKRIRKDGLIVRPFKWLLVSELGTKKGRPHFHALVFVRKHPGDDYNTCIDLQQKLYNLFLSQWKRNYSDDIKHPHWKPLCTYFRKFYNGEWHYNYDCQYVLTNDSRDVSRVGMYITKYMLKPSDRAVRLQRALKLNLTPEEYVEAWPKIKPRCSWSKDFGSPKFKNVREYLEKCVNASISSGSEFPFYFSPADGKSMVLSRYYRTDSRVLPVDKALAFFENHVKSKNVDDGRYELEVSDIVQRAEGERRLKKIRNFVENFHQDPLDFEDLFLSLQ